MLTCIYKTHMCGFEGLFRRYVVFFFFSLVGLPCIEYEKRKTTAIRNTIKMLKVIFMKKKKKLNAAWRCIRTLNKRSYSNAKNTKRISSAGIEHDDTPRYS